MLVDSSTGVCIDGVGDQEGERCLDDSYRGVWAQEYADIVAVVLERLYGARDRSKDYYWLLISQN